MKKENLVLNLFLSLMLTSCAAQKDDSAQLKRVYRDVDVGTYKTQLNLAECEGKTFLHFMKSKVYPAIEAESYNRQWGQHIDGVKSGEGVELRLTDDVTTYHVKYKRADEEKAERSGRSFSAVGQKSDGTYEYVADASYAHYFDSFERQLGYDESFLADFYRAIFGVLVSCDASELARLNKYEKRLAADFIAVYVAEQYRHLLSGKGQKLGRSHNWDDALLQTTMLLAFHSGQSHKHMYYRGEFTGETYDQYGEVDGEAVCVYKNWNDERRSLLEKRDMQLRDYWQPNKTCERSGVNLTRRDFDKMGSQLARWFREYENTGEQEVIANIMLETRPDLDGVNIINDIAGYFVSNSAPESFGGEGAELVASIVAYLMVTRSYADQITESINNGDL